MSLLTAVKSSRDTLRQDGGGGVEAQRIYGLGREQTGSHSVTRKGELHETFYVFRSFFA